MLARRRGGRKSKSWRFSQEEWLDGKGKNSRPWEKSSTWVLSLSVRIIKTATWSCFLPRSSCCRSAREWAGSYTRVNYRYLELMSRSWPIPRTTRTLSKSQVVYRICRPVLFILLIGFLITGALIDRIVAVCQTKEDQQSWVEALSQAIRSIRKSSVSSPNPPPHVSSQFTCPYTELTSYFATLVKSGVITRALLKRLLYRQCGPENVNIVGVKVRRNQKVECVIFPTKISFSAFKPTRTYIKSQSSDDSGSTSPRTISTLSDGITHILMRQDAVDCESPVQEENPYGYIKYYSPERKRSSVSVRLNCVGMNTDLSGSQSAGSSFDVPPKPITLRACEDLTTLVTLDPIHCDARGSLPAPLTPEKHSALWERSASADPGILPTEEFARADMGAVNRYDITDLCECSEDIGGTPRSSDSGLADVTSTCTITLPDLPQPWVGISPTASLSHTFNAEFEELSSYHSARTSAPPFITSDVIFVKNATGPVDSFPATSAVVYRSGMYAHWWMKTHIPAAAVKLSPRDDKGKPSVQLTSQNELFSVCILCVKPCVI